LDVALLQESLLNIELLSGQRSTPLIAQKIPDHISLLNAVTEFLNGISIGELQRVFRSWIARVENIIAAEGAMHPHKCPACHYLM
jgi:hypothetical protein